MAQAVSRRSVTAEARIRARSLYVGFVVDKVALGQALLRVILSFPCPCHFTVALHTHVSSRG
jgi:hypothetical protein